MSQARSEAESDGWILVLSCFLLIVQPRTEAKGMVLPTFSVGFLTSGSLLSINPHKNTQRPNNFPQVWLVACLQSDFRSCGIPALVLHVFISSTSLIVSFQPEAFKFYLLLNPLPSWNQAWILYSHFWVIWLKSSYQFARRLGRPCKPRSGRLEGTPYSFPFFG